jgi:hypothetical protein
MQTLNDRLPKHWTFEGANTDEYAVGIDATTPYNGKPSLLIQSADADLEDYFRLYQVVNLSDWHGQRLRVSGFFRSEAVASHGVISISVYTQTNELLVYDAMIDRSLRGDNEWQKLETVFDVPANARFVYFGPTLWGPGKLWAAEFHVEVVSRDVQRTDLHGHVELLPDGPIDLEIPEIGTGSPREYFKAARGWRYDSSPEALYRCERVPTAFGELAAWTITSKGEQKPVTTDRDTVVGYVMQTFSAVPFRGKKIKFSAQIKSENCNDRCGLVLMVQGPFYRWKSIATMQEECATGTSDWHEYSRVLAVSEQAYSIAIWLQLDGGGKGWFSDIRVTEADVDEKVTQRGAGPLNLDFSEIE